MKTWTINLKVDTSFIADIKKHGRWHKPIKLSKNCDNHFQLIAISSNVADDPVIDNCSELTLSLCAGDLIRWTTSTINGDYNPLQLSLCMYRLKTGRKWAQSLTPVETINTETVTVSLKNGYDAEHKPIGDFLIASASELLTPQTCVRADAKSGSISYKIELLLVDARDIQLPTVTKYLSISSKIDILLGSHALPSEL